MKGRRPMQALLLLLLICGIAEPVHIQAQTTSPHSGAGVKSGTDEGSGIA